MPLRHLDQVTEHARHRLALESGAKPSEALAAYKKFLKVEEHRLRLLHRSGGSGHEVAAGRAQMMDIILQHLVTATDRHYREKHPNQTAAFALVAIGGYGRGELSPFSDVDIMFLHSLPGRAAKHPYLSQMVEEVLYMLWDIGLKVGHSTRSISEATAQANADMQSKTSLIESRLVIGDKTLYAAFRGALVKDCVRGKENAYIDERMADQKARHEKYGDSVYMQEPHLKNGCGGLRDFQNLIWMAFFKYGVLNLADLRKKGFLERTEQRDLEAAYEFILQLRNTLHYLTNRPSDVITLGIQPRIAREFGYRHHDPLRRMEALMRDYYTHARNIFLITNMLAERMALRPPRFARLATLLPRSSRKQETFDGFVVEQGLIQAQKPQVFRQDPLRLMRVFRQAQHRELELGPELRNRIRNSLHYVDRGFQRAPEARTLFFEILRRKGQVGRILRLMHETGFLGKYLPEFGKLTCLVQHEFFHRYTADEHTLQVVEHLDRVLDAQRPPHANYRKIFQQLDHAHLLYLAILLHDTGKAANVERHAEASVELARKCSRRLRLGEDETQRLVFLVRDHLKLSMLSQRRDLDDLATIEAAARVVKNEDNLDMLHLLTFADAAGTSLKTWSDWKDALLWELYHRTRQALTGPERAKNILARRIGQLYDEVSQQLRKQLPLEEIYSHFELMPASYYIKNDAATIAEHLHLIHDFFVRQLEVEQAADALAPLIHWQHAPEHGFSQVNIVTWDRVGLFSKICASLAAAELNILRARVYTRGDNVVLDIFEVADAEQNAVTNQRAIQTTETLLNRTLGLEEEPDFEAIMERIQQRRLASRKLRDVVVPTEIRFDNEISPNRTVVEVQAEDRIGLLYTLTEIMSRLSLNISIAKIATEKGAAIDAFYVTDADGNKITDRQHLDHIKERMADAIGTPPPPPPG